MIAYSIYGLRLQVNQAMPGLVALSDEATADLQIWFGWLPDCRHDAFKDAAVWYVSRELEEDNEPSLIIYESAGGDIFWFKYHDGTEFVFDHQRNQVWGTWPENLTLEDAALNLLGSVLAVYLYLRKVACLHASAVAIGDCAVAMVGDSGAGKSTTAAAFAHLGYRVLSDDVVTLHEQAEQFIVHPAYPYIRLWPSSVKLLYGAVDALPLLTPNWDKLCLHLIDRGHQFSAKPLPLSAIYILGDHTASPAAPFIEAVTPNAALLNLVINTYAINLLDKDGRAREFDLLGRLIASLPVRRAVPHEDPARLFNLCQTIAEDFHELLSGSSGSSLAAPGKPQHYSLSKGFPPRPLNKAEYV